VAALLAVQRAAGNAAVGRLLARQEAPVLEPAPGRGTPYQAIPGTAFASPVGGGQADIDPDDVTQGGIGDCWLAASMAAVARARPEVIRSAIRTRGDGTYDVSLYLGEDGRLILSPDPPRTVQVTSNFPMRAGAPAYAQPGDASAAGPELWPMLIEKAYAAMISGGYPGLAGGVEGRGQVGGLQALLGTAAATTQISPQTTDAQVLADIGGALAGRRPVICTTPAEYADPASEAAAARVRIRSNHAYAPVSVDGDTIHLQDPNHHRDLSLPVATFRQVFADYSLAGDATPRVPPVGGPVQIPAG
jgi:Calpain family cysteine protease